MDILLVEDDVNLRDLIAFILRGAGHGVITAADGETGLSLRRQYNPHLTVVEVALPDMSGWELFRAIRHESNVPVIFLSKSRVESEVMLGLEIGAEGFITNPFTPSIVKSRIADALRRSKKAEHDSIDIGSLVLTFDQLRYQVWLGSRLLSVTPIEFKILMHLYDNIDYVVSYSELNEAVLDLHDTSSKHLKVHMYNLRHKLSRIGYGNTIVAIPREGYLFSKMPATIVKMHKYGLDTKRPSHTEVNSHVSRDQDSTPVKPQEHTAHLALEFDELQSQVAYGGRAVRLTPTEFRILDYLYRNSSRVVPRSELNNVVLPDVSGSKHLKVHFHNLRAKLRSIEYGGTIEVVRSTGYFLSANR
jgi:two-component system, OmpR family, response regulator